jgi:accessory colonization factor AcfC
MRHRLFVLFGADKCEIFSKRKVSRYDEIREDINIYEFHSVEELEAFKKGVDEAIGWNDYALLSDDDVAAIMEGKAEENYVDERF